MDAVDKLRAEHALELEKLQRELEVVAVIPLPWRERARVTEYARAGQRTYIVTIPADGQVGVAEALQVYTAFESAIVPCGRWRDGSLSCVPDALHEPARDQVVREGEHVAEIHVSGGRGYGPDITLGFWAACPYGLLHVRVIVAGLHKVIPSSSTEYDKRGNVARSDVRWPPCKHDANGHIAYWSPPGSYSGLYWFESRRRLEAFVC